MDFRRRAKTQLAAARQLDVRRHVACCDGPVVADAGLAIFD
jgi:hypothetical protein